MAHCRAPEVDADLDDIWYYAAKNSGSMDIADRLIDSITDRFFLLADYPHLGRARDEDLRWAAELSSRRVRCHLPSREQRCTDPSSLTR